ncbi:ATP-binding protein [Streptomyces sp. NPDC059913]|uniref:ATP-binding protein n=1 Tax=unclassified Streptomyces TaxID=2593676 RepID=UPI00366703EB
MTSVHTTAHPSPPGPPGSEIYRLTLPNTSGAAKVSRDFVASLLGVSRCGGLAGLVDDARLCVTEVVANAHRHTATALIQVHVAVGDERVTVAVADDDHWALPRCPEQRGGSCQPEGGRGLLLVERVAAAWGTRVLGEGVPYRKAVWFTLGGDGGRVRS